MKLSNAEVKRQNKIAVYRQVLRVGRNVAYELVRSGQLRSVRVGKNIRIPRDALADYLNLAS